MANWSNPLLTSTYTNFVTEVKDRDVDLALQFDGVTATNIPTNTIRWNSSINRWQKWSGTAWGELTSTYALTAITATGSVTCATLIPTSSTAPTNGVYLPAANAVGVATASTGRLFVDSTGRVMVGPSTLLSSPPGSATSLLQIQSTGDDAFLLTGDSFVGQQITSYRTSASDHAVQNLYAARGTRSAPSLLSDGDVVSTQRHGGWTGSNFAPGVVVSAFIDGTPSASSMPMRYSIFTTPSGSLVPVERLRVLSNGRLRIGQTTTDTPGFTNTTVGIGIEPDNGAVFLSRADGGTGVSLNSNLASGTAAPIEFRRSSVVTGSITTTTTTTAYNTTSDYRLKQNVQPITDASFRLLQLNPCRFNFIAAPGTTFDGFLAHEAQSVVPESVTGQKDAVDDQGAPIYQGIDQSKLVPLLVAALQEALTEIDLLKTRVTALEAS